MAERLIHQRAAHRPVDQGPPGFGPLPPGLLVDLGGRGQLFLREAWAETEAPAATLVLLHGLTATADLNWFAAFEPLRRRYRLVAPDQRGHGDGIRPRAYRLIDLADDVAALIEHLDLTGGTVLVGFSMGGAVAQLVWQRHRRLVDGLVLCSTAADHTDHSRRGRLLDQPLRQAMGWAGRVAPPTVRARLVATARRSTRQRLQPEPTRDSPLQRWAGDQLLRSDPLHVASASAALRRFRSTTWAGTIDVPTAVVITTRDAVVPTSRQRELAALVPDASVHEVQAGHGAFIEDTDAFVPALVAACDDVVARLAAPSVSATPHTSGSGRTDWAGPSTPSPGTGPRSCWSRHPPTPTR